MSSLNDLSVTTFTQDGHIKQVSYAQAAVNSSETIIGVKCKDGIILGAEKQLFSNLLVEDTDRRVYNIEKNIGMVIGGMRPDGRNVVYRARKEAQEYLKNFAMPISGRILSERSGQYIHAHTLYGYYRPMGCAVIISSYDPIDGLQLHMADPSGLCIGYNACAQGKERQVAMTYLGKRQFSQLTCREALPYILQILNLTHQEVKERKYHYDVSWITEENNYVHQLVPKDIKDQAQVQALQFIEEEENAD